MEKRNLKTFIHQKMIQCFLYKTKAMNNIKIDIYIISAEHINSSLSYQRLKIVKYIYKKKIY